MELGFVKQLTVKSHFTYIDEATSSNIFFKLFTFIHFENITVLNIRV
jgi:hypothetical protein